MDTDPAFAELCGQVDVLMYDADGGYDMASPALLTPQGVTFVEDTLFLAQRLTL